MKEQTRVTLGIILWAVVLLGFIVAGVSYIINTEKSAVEEIAESVAESAPEVPVVNIERVEPEVVGLDSRHLAYIADKVEEYIAKGATKGAVVTVVRDGKIAYMEAFGEREHGGEAMTIDTRFDLASLTKPVVTATAIMQLVERGNLRLDERVSNLIPEFEDYAEGKGKKRRVVYATVGDLMSHCSGLRPYVALTRLEEDYPDMELDKEVLLDYIAHSERLGAPREVTKYSCLNYILLGEIVERCSGVSLEEYARTNIFEPLKMSNTCYRPDAEYALLAAPTSLVGAEEELRGLVNDPLAREVMGGVSGNAGLFSTAEDLAIFVAMLLEGGEWQGERVLTPRGVDELFTQPDNVKTTRTLAWERLSNSFEALEDGQESAVFVHTGATGTSIHIDRQHDMAVIILTNRTHADGSSRDIKELRRSVATIASYAIVE